MAKLDKSQESVHPQNERTLWDYRPVDRIARATGWAIFFPAYLYLALLRRNAFGWLGITSPGASFDGDNDITRHGSLFDDGKTEIDNRYLAATDLKIHHTPTVPANSDDAELLAYLDKSIPPDRSRRHHYP